MQIGSIASGLGRLDAAVAALLGDGGVTWCAEPDPLCRKVLATQVPQTPLLVADGEQPRLDPGSEPRLYHDARQARAADGVDVLVGGTPCQDLSTAGRRAGADGERSSLLTIIPDLADRLSPMAVCWENVPGASTAPGPGGRGTALGWLVDALTARGWAVAHTVIPASWVGAPHRRRRLFLLAVRAHMTDAAPRLWEGAGSLPHLGRPLAPLSPLLPTPTASMHTGPGRQGRAGGLNLQTAIALGRHGACEPQLSRWAEITGRTMPEIGCRLTVEFAAWMMGIDPLLITQHRPSRTAAMRAIGNSVVAEQAATAYWLLAQALADRVPDAWADAPITITGR